MQVQHPYKNAEIAAMPMTADQIGYLYMNTASGPAVVLPSITSCLRSFFGMSFSNLAGTLELSVFIICFFVGDRKNAIK